MRETSESAFTSPLKGVRILLVEDYTDARELFAMLLTLSGAEVVAVGSGAAAVAALALSRFDVLVSDIHMPEMSGLALIREIRASPEASDLPAVAVTADQDPTMHDEVLKAGFQKRLAKPVLGGELVATVRELVAAA